MEATGWRHTRRPEHTMTWNGIGDFLHMGGYGLYVWGSYAVTLGLLAAETVVLMRRERGLTRRLSGRGGER